MAGLDVLHPKRPKYYGVVTMMTSGCIEHPPFFGFHMERGNVINSRFSAVQIVARKRGLVPSHGRKAASKFGPYETDGRGGGSPWGLSTCGAPKNSSGSMKSFDSWECFGGQQLWVLKDLNLFIKEKWWEPSAKLKNRPQIKAKRGPVNIRGPRPHVSVIGAAPIMK